VVLSFSTFIDSHSQGLPVETRKRSGMRRNDNTTLVHPLPWSPQVRAQLGPAWLPARASIDEGVFFLRAVLLYIALQRIPEKSIGTQEKWLLRRQVYLHSGKCLARRCTWRCRRRQAPCTDPPQGWASLCRETRPPTAYTRGRTARGRASVRRWSRRWQGTSAGSPSPAARRPPSIPSCVPPPSERAHANGRCWHHA
jgi:hypothetical protein